MSNKQQSPIDVAIEDLRTDQSKKKYFLFVFNSGIMIRMTPEDVDKYLVKGDDNTFIIKNKNYKFEGLNFYNSNWEYGYNNMNIVGVFKLK